MDLTLTPRGSPAPSRARSRSLYWRRVRLRRRLQRHLHSSEVSIISSNCIGGRISTLAGNPYRSPTVGLSIDPESFLELVSDLPPVPDPRAQRGCGSDRTGGLPGRPHGCSDAALPALPDVRRRGAALAGAGAAHIDIDNVVLLCTDRNGMSPDRIARFAALSTPRRVILTAKPYPSFDCAAAVPAFAGASQVGELYTHWDLLEPVPADPAWNSSLTAVAVCGPPRRPTGRNLHARGR